MRLSRPTFALLAAGLLPGCAGGCEGPDFTLPPPQSAASPAPGPAVPDATGPRRVTAATRALEGHLGLQLPARSRSDLFGTLPARPGVDFDQAALNRRFWLAWGPRGLVANERALLGAGPLDAVAVQAALAQAIPDWQARSGVAPKSVLLVVDAGTDEATAALLHQAVTAAASWRLATLALEPDGAPVELPLAGRVAAQADPAARGRRGGEETRRRP